MTRLVEVALPLEEISAASRRDKDRKVGTIKNVHKWFAPMPTPAWRALLFATIVDDPGDDAEREKLLELVKELVPADGTAPAQEVLDRANRLMREATGGELPTVYDPFCGGGSTLVEAQRLGLPAAGSDLNPVPVLITRVLTELVPQMAGRPALKGDPTQLKGMTGGPLDGFLADCRHYAHRVRDEVWAEIGHLYPEAPGGGTVIAWLWARTVTCPNPACGATAPLVSSFWLSKKKGALTWIEPIPQGPGQPVRFEARTGTEGPSWPKGTKQGRGGTFRCVTCDEPVPEAHVKAEGTRVGLGEQLMATAVQRPDGRHYLSPDEAGAPPTASRPADAPSVRQPDYARWFSSPAYGMEEFADLHTDRQLVALTAFADAVARVPNLVRTDGGDDAQGAGIASILGLCVSKLATSHSSQARWYIGGDNGSVRVQAAFGRHALPMVWDFVEINPFGKSFANWGGMLAAIESGVRSLAEAAQPTQTFQADAREGGVRVAAPHFVAADPPYFAQIGYADLSDYFYVWLRQALRAVHPDLFATVATPKAAELIAAPHRHGGKEAATTYFVDGFTKTFANLRGASDPDLPTLIVYAHRQEESSDSGMSSTAWDAMLSAILKAGLRIVGTWPIHATGSTRQIGQGTNAVASYVVLVCRPQLDNAKVVDLPAFRSALRADLPRAIRKLQQGAISSIDLGQATLGPGMAIFSRYAKVIDPATGEGMTVRAALEVISGVQAEVLDEFTSSLDRFTRWGMAWYAASGFSPGEFDVAEKICKTTNTSLNGLIQAGLVTSRAGKVTLIARADMPDDWTPDTDDEVTVWEVVNHMARVLASDGGEQAAGGLLRQCARWADDARDLAYWLSVKSAEKGRAADTLDYDALVTSWPELQRIAESTDPGAPSSATQPTLDGL